MSVPLEGFPYTWTAEDVAHPYDPAAFTDDDDCVWCKVTLVYTDGQTRCVTGNYLAAYSAFPMLMCGIYDLCDDLGLPEPSDPVCLAVSEAVDKQLSWRPLVRLRCKEFSIRLDLVEPAR